VLPFETCDPISEPGPSPPQLTCRLFIELDDGILDIAPGTEVEAFDAGGLAGAGVAGGLIPLAGCRRPDGFEAMLNVVLYDLIKNIPNYIRNKISCLHNSLISEKAWLDMSFPASRNIMRCFRVQYLPSFTIPMKMIDREPTTDLDLLNKTKFK